MITMVRTGLLGALLLVPLALAPAPAAAQAVQGESRRNVPDWIDRAREAGEREPRRERRAAEEGRAERRGGEPPAGRERVRRSERFEDRAYGVPRRDLRERDVIVRERVVGPRFGGRTVCRERWVRRYNPRLGVVVERPVRDCREVW